VLNKRVFACETIRDMHDTTKRLYEATRFPLRGLPTQTDVARFLNELPQMTNNRERRGISKAGCLPSNRSWGAALLASNRPPDDSQGNQTCSPVNLSNREQRTKNTD